MVHKVNQNREYSATKRFHLGMSPPKDPRRGLLIFHEWRLIYPSTFCLSMKTVDRRDEMYIFFIPSPQSPPKKTNVPKFKAENYDCHRIFGYVHRKQKLYLLLNSSKISIYQHYNSLKSLVCPP